MQIALAQVKPQAGQLAYNWQRHERFIQAAVDADLIVFPELSLTGYEPTRAGELAVDLATTPPILNDLLVASARAQIVIAAGLPTRSPKGTRISTLFAFPEGHWQLYSKQHLHVDERPWFIPGSGPVTVVVAGKRIAIAICYELSQPAHFEAALAEGAELYVASVAKTASGIAAAHRRLAEIAEAGGIPSLISNCLGLNDGFIGGGRSAVWNRDGHRLAELDDQHEGLLIFDAQNVTSRTLAI